MMETKVIPDSPIIYLDQCLCFLHRTFGRSLISEDEHLDSPVFFQLGSSIVTKFTSLHHRSSSDSSHVSSSSSISELDLHELANRFPQPPVAIKQPPPPTRRHSSPIPPQVAPAVSLLSGRKHSNSTPINPTGSFKDFTKCLQISVCLQGGGVYLLQMH
jgi:hypothetical protein